MKPAWPHGDPRDLARSIVADARYTGTTHPDAAPGLLERIAGWIGERFADLVRGIGHLLGAQNPFNSAIGIVAVVAALGALGYLVYRLRPSPASRVRARVANVPLDPTTGSREWLERALAAARLERWRDAAAALFTAALHRLDEGGRLAYDPARTAGEARRAVNDPAFDALAREGSIALFDARGATAERFGRMRDMYARAFEGQA